MSKTAYYTNKKVFDSSLLPSLRYILHYNLGMIIYHYVCSNLLKTSIGLAIALTVLIVFNRFAFYIDDAADGKIPSALVLVLLANRLPELLAIILPLTLVISILITYEQLFMNNELSVLHSSGMSRHHLFAAMFISASLLIAGITWITCYVSPWGFQNINHSVAKIKEKQFEFLPEASFFKLGGLNIYIKELDSNNQRFNQIFAVDEANKDTITIAESGSFEQRDEHTYLILNNGQRLQKNPETGTQQIIEFEHYGERIPEIDRAIKVYDRALTMNIMQLFNTMVNGTSDNHITSQFYWNISIPLMTIILCWIAFALCNNQPRSARFRELLPMVIIFVTYFILLKTARDNVESGSLAIEWFGPTHAGFILLACLLTLRQNLKQL